jgi:EmrB/QacA subfamily drug resistance transporter
MKTQPADIIRRTSDTPKAERAGQTPSTLAKPTDEPAKPAISLSPQAAKRILISLMVPGMIMPMASSMSRVALPIIRGDFQIPADMTAWVATVFTLPFMILMPVYGRLSDGLGKRRLILAGIVIFSIGTTITLLATDLAWLMVGRAIQGIGVAGMMPLGMALISTIFRADERGRALGTWSSIGPTIAFLGPLAAGFLVEGWGWRAAFAPPLVISIVAFLVVFKLVPAGLSDVKPNFLRTFDWVGVILMAGAITTLLFYLSSRPITGVAPLHDWRLLTVTLLLLGGFLFWEKQRQDPFVRLDIFADRTFSRASFCASMRMFAMGGMGFLIPLYLVDVHRFSAAYIGGMLMINPGMMALIVRFGGQLADRWGSRWPVVVGLGVQASVMVIFSQLPGTAPIWVMALTLGYHGLGAGLMQAALHRAAVGNIAAARMGAAAGLYSMLRFTGVVIGTALAGVILQNYLDQALPVIEAYQNVFLFLAGFSISGVIVGFSLREPKTASAKRREAITG